MTLACVNAIFGFHFSRLHRKALLSGGMQWHGKHFALHYDAVGCITVHSGPDMNGLHWAGGWVGGHEQGMQGHGTGGAGKGGSATFLT